LGDGAGRRVRYRSGGMDTKEDKRKIVTAENISFCFGVQKSLERIDDILKSGKYKNVYMLGELIHNVQVISELKKKGVTIIEDINDIPDIPPKSIVIIQSHGVGPSVYKKLEGRNILYMDSTCILVKKIHRAISRLEKDGYYPVILGDPEHTEVKGIAGYVRQKPIIIESVEDINPNDFGGKERVGIVMQSTFFLERVEEIVGRIRSLVKEVKVVDTICQPTKARQSEIDEKSKLFKSVVVVGSKGSSNTKKLYHISRANNKNTFLVSSEEDVWKYDFSGLFPLFLISGASSPHYLVESIKAEILKSVHPFYRFSRRYTGQVEAEIEALLDESIKENSGMEIKKILKALKEFILRPGKRIRPLLLIWGYLAWRGDERKLKEAVKAAAIVEMMHAFLLIHDDIMDNADLRRGGKSFHLMMKDNFSFLTYNENIGRDIAITVGDILFALSVEAIASLKIARKVKNDFLGYFGRCYFLTGVGQVYDLLASQPKAMDRVTAEDRRGKVSWAERINLLKTSYYTIYYPILMGAALSGGLVERRGEGYKSVKQAKEAIEEMAIPLGKAFQMRDDVISIFGDTEKTGKPDSSDILEGKTTVLIEETLRSLKGKEREEFERLFVRKNKGEREVALIREAIAESGALSRVRRETEKLFKESREKLSLLKVPDDYKKIVADLIDILSDY